MEDISTSSAPSSTAESTPAADTATTTESTSAITESSNSTSAADTTESSALGDSSSSAAAAVTSSTSEPVTPAQPPTITHAADEHSADSGDDASEAGDESSTAVSTPAFQPKESIDIDSLESTTNAASSATTATDPTAANNAYESVKHSHDVYFTAAQAAAENKKLKPGCGWRWMAVQPVKPIILHPIETQPRQRRMTKGPANLDDDDTASQSSAPSTPALKGRSRPSTSHPPAAAAAATPAAKTKGTKRTAPTPSPIAPPADPVIDEKQRELMALEERIAQLRREQEMLTGGTPVPSTPGETPKGKKRKTLPPVTIPPSTPTLARGTSAASTPGLMTPGQSSRTGRNIKAPQLYREEIEPPTEQKQLKKCRILLDHLIAHKNSQGIFASPVNWEDPNQPFYAPNYLQIIGSSNRPIDLSEIKGKLTNNEYANVEEFAKDVRMVYRNAMLYNPPGDWINRAASDCLNTFERELDRIENGTDNKRARTSGGGDDHHDEKRPSKRVKGETKSKSAVEMPLAGLELMEQMADRIKALEAKLAAGGTGGAVSTPVAPVVETPVYKPPVAAPAYRGPAAAPAPAYKKPAPVPIQKTQQPLSQREKQQLKEDIFKLPSHKLGPVVEIISKAMPKTEQKDDADEIEIDIDKLDIPTLRDLQAYVRKALTALKRTSKPTQPRRNTPATGGSGPRASPQTPVGMGAARSTPAAGSPLTNSPYPRTSPSAAAAMQSPARLETPATPNALNRGTSQAIGNVTPALKYDSSSDDSDSSSDDSDSDEENVYTSHISAAALEGAAPSMLDP